MTGNKGNGTNTSFWGRTLCAVGIVLAVIGAYFVSVALGAVGITLGWSATPWERATSGA